MAGWYGVDFDGTLAVYDPEIFPEVGAPIMPMVARVRRWLNDGEEVRIVTARADHPRNYLPVYAFCRDQFGMMLPVTDRKDRHMIELWDDRARHVLPDGGAAHELLEIATQRAEILIRQLNWGYDKIEALIATPGLADMLRETVTRDQVVPLAAVRRHFQE